MPISDEHKLAMALGRQKAREERLAAKRERQSRGVDYAEQMDRGGHNPTTPGFAAELVQALGAAGVLNAPGLRASQVKRFSQAAWDEMVEAVEEMRRNGGEKPIYELTLPMFCDDILIPASRNEGGRAIATRIRFPDIPNESFIPKNEPARHIYSLYMKAIGGQTPDLGDQTMEAYLRRPRLADLVDGPIEQAQVMSQPKSIPEARVEVLEDTPLEERTYLGVRKVLGTVQPEIAGKLF
jgi:hypothetical protein